MTDGSGKTLYLVDGTSQLFRAYFAIRGLTNAEGLPTNAVYGFTTMLRKLLKEERPTHVAVAFDMPGEVFRHAAYAEYKANRPPAPEDLNAQVPYAKQICEVLGVSIMERAGFEADDLIATSAGAAREAGFDVVVVASDKDLLQLVGEGVTVLNPSKNVRLDTAGVAESFGVPPPRVRDVLGLMGDAVDNIPGVPGVGGKTALAVVGTYGDVEEVIARAARFVVLYDARDVLLAAIQATEKPGTAGGAVEGDLAKAVNAFTTALGAFVDREADPGIRGGLGDLRESMSELERDAGPAERGDKQALRRVKAFKKELKAMDRGSSKRVWYAIHEHADQARLSRELATLNTEAPLDHTPDELALREPDAARVHALFRSLGFQTLLADFADGASGEAGEAGGEAPPGGQYETLLDLDGLRQAVRACRDAGRFVVRTVTDGGDPLRARLVGVSLAHRPGRAAYIPVGHAYLGAPDQLSVESVARILGPLLADGSIDKVGHDLKRDAHVLRRHGMPVVGWIHDTMVAAFLLASDRSSYATDRLAREFLGHEAAPLDELTGTGAKRLTLDQVEVEQVARHAAERAELTLRLAEHLQERLRDSDLDEVYSKIDGPLLPVLVRMEVHGIRVDTDRLRRMSDEIQGALESARDEIHRLAGTAVNIDSPKQLRELLFDRLGLKPRRKTAKGGVASTDAQTLEELAPEHPIAGKILEYRELAKLKGTYVDALPRLVHPDTGRIHTSYHPTGAATGRLSSSDPNLQNIPTRTAAGRQIRSAFVPDPGCSFLASDYSQVELRVLAHLTGDEALVAAFRAGEDIHIYTASKVFGVAPDLVSDTMRRRAKAVNFGILYGMSETRLAREQGMKRGEAREFIRTYFDRFARVRGYIDEVRARALRDGAVRTMFGRVRFFPQLRQKIHRGIQEQALRAAVNTTIQGTAADLMKLAMLRVDAELERLGRPARILLQVHDELLLEVPETNVDDVAGLVRHAMEEVHPLDVPLAVDQKTGDSWLAVS